MKKRLGKQEASRQEEAWQKKWATIMSIHRTATQMGCWDIYCCVCAGPFSRFSMDYRECKYINDAWLEKVTIEYIDKLTYPDRDIIR